MFMRYPVYRIGANSIRFILNPGYVLHYMDDKALYFSTVVNLYLSTIRARPCTCHLTATFTIPDSKVHGDNMGPIWGRQDPGGPHVGPMNFAIWEYSVVRSHIQAPFYQHWLISIVVWMSNHTPNKVLEDITYPFTKCRFRLHGWTLENE